MGAEGAMLLVNYTHRLFCPVQFIAGGSNTQCIPQSFILHIHTNKLWRIDNLTCGPTFQKSV